jgi:hypothetical protein
MLTAYFATQMLRHAADAGRVSKTLRGIGAGIVIVSKNASDLEFALDLKENSRATMRTVITLAAALSFFGAAADSFAAHACSSLENSTQELRLEYLKGERERLNSDCVLYAMEELGYYKYTPAINVLIRYLDYRDPAKMPGFRQTHIEWSGSIYPVGDALFQIGKPAIPELIEVIADAATSDLGQNNAADVVSAIYREDLAEGVAVLVRAARAQTDPLASLRLIDQARRQAAHCGNERRNDCENAI